MHFPNSIFQFQNSWKLLQGKAEGAGDRHPIPQPRQTAAECALCVCCVYGCHFTKIYASFFF